MNYEPVIGIEVHAQLRTASKLFCGCSTVFGATPNAHTCPVCLALPGCLPVLNQGAVELAVRAALGLSCTVHTRSQWSRKNYFYPDLPKGYQISQYDQPLATGGQLDVEVDGVANRVGITRVHMEEDAGKNVHDAALAGTRSYVDFNRSGVPLVEIVTEPDIRSAAVAAATMRKLRQILGHLGVCDGNMEEGSLRCDVNVSVRPVGQQRLGTRTELKNINSFRFVQAAVEFEILRQTQTLEAQGRVVQETRLWDATARVTRAMRGKEEAHDYRYFPDPDLPDLVLEPGYVERVRVSLNELPDVRRRRYVERFGLSDYDATALTDTKEVADYFDAVVARHPNYKAAANWIINELLREARAGELGAVRVSGEQLGELLGLIDDQTISGKIAKDVFSEMMRTGSPAAAIVEAKGLRQVIDTAALERAVEQVLAAHPDSVAQFRAGKVKLLGFFVGRVMQATGGKANPQRVNELLRRRLEA